MPYVQTGNDEDGNPTYAWEEDFTSGGYDSNTNYGYVANPYDDPSRQLDLNYGQFTDPGVILYPDGTPSNGSGVGGLTGTGGDATVQSGLSRLASRILGSAGTPGGIAALAAGLYGTLGGNKPTGDKGYTKVIDPNAMTATRTAIAQPAYTPYSGQPVMGRKNFTDVEYTPRTAAVAPSSPVGIAPPDQVGGGGVTGGAAQGGLMGFAVGGRAKGPRYLEGATDGMADKISTSIDGDQPAALSHGEFVIPADVVSHLGNGNSKAGADVLYKMMDRVRHARTGSKKQGKEINPAKFTPGGIAGYAGGGVVAFAGETGSLVGAGQGTSTSMPVSSSSNLSSWAGPGVADYIQKGTALSQSPYQAYTGPLTAGVSPLQQQGFATAGSLQTPATMGQATQMVGSAGAKMGELGYKPMGSDFTPQAAQQYMNPYLQASLDPQLAEARRQSQITQMGNASKLTQAGAFGGSRGAIMDAETQRNLGTNLANITGQGYNTAYDKATGQFNADQQRKIQEGQFGSNFGLQALQGQQSAGTALGGLGAQENAMGIANLNAQMGAGATQRGIEQEGIGALKAQFEEERQNPYKQVQFAQSLYQGLPVSTTTASTATTPFQQLKDILSGAGGVYDQVNTMTGG